VLCTMQTALHKEGRIDPRKRGEHRVSLAHDWHQIGARVGGP